MSGDGALGVLSADDSQLSWGGGAQPEHCPRYAHQGGGRSGGGLKRPGSSAHTIQVRQRVLLDWC